MDFATAVRTCLSKYVAFAGRARRSEFWWFYLFAFVAGITAGILDRILGTDIEGSNTGLIDSVVSLALFLPLIAAGSRRLHDTGRSGWWQLLWVIPILGWIPLIIWLAKDSDHGDNKHGPSPQEGPSSTAHGYPPPTGTPYHGQ